MTALAVFYLCFFNSVDSLAADTVQIDYYHAPNVLKFAEYLYQEKDFSRAAGEYYRYLFCFDSFPPNTDTIYYRLGNCYQQVNNHKKAIDFYEKTHQLTSDTDLASSALFNIGKSFTLMKDYNSSSDFISSHINDIQNREISRKMRQLRIANNLYSAQWQQAIDWLEQESESDTITNLLKKFADEGMNLPHKSPVLAGIYSGLIPGTGKLYTNRFYEGIQSFFTVGIMGWQSYDGFDEDGISSIKGWIFGIVGGLFYLGNIYGSIVGAEIYNEEVENKHIEKIRVYVNIDID